MLLASNSRQVFLTHSLPASFFIQERVVFAHEHACEHELAKLNPTVAPVVFGALMDTRERMKGISK